MTWRQGIVVDGDKAMHTAGELTGVAPAEGLGVRRAGGGRRAG